MLVALSGGGDSMALLSLFMSSFSGRVVAAHLEHGLRGEASLADARFVEEYCRASGVVCHVRRADVDSLRRAGESCETAGRRIRYEFFREILDLEGLPFVATAHNSGDVAETVTHRFFRGTGVAGLSGIAERRGRVVRPLICASRGELREYLLAAGVPWREDETNGENFYTRNKIRNELLPWARANLNEAAEGAILGLAGECSRVSSGLAAEAGVMLRLAARAHPLALAAWDAATARRMSATQLSSALRLQAEKLGLPVADRRGMANLARMIMSGARGRFQWAGDVEVCCGGSLIGWIRRGLLEPPPPAAMALAEGDRLEVEWGAWVVRLEMRRRGAAEEFACRPGVSRAELFSHDAVGVAAISDASSFAQKINGSFRVKIPWWSARGAPVLSWRSDNSSGFWLPSERYAVHGEGIYVIIANVFVRGDRDFEGEK
jgi:tRNA(Ile)-lysidine synthase